jgi:transcriptional regulator with XRE-family HTH domain
MGIGSRFKPLRLAEKLVQIRTALGLSQNEMIFRLGLTDAVIREDVSAFELGKRQPPLKILLEYARCVGISTDILIDDKLNLPDRLLKAARGVPTRRKSGPQTKRKR